MEYGKLDSSGTDDDPSLQHFYRTTKGARFSGAVRIAPVTVPRETDLEFQIHCIETEAYSAVLRAFIAQSDVLSWDKEGLISELRKELRVSDFEHREILVKVESDDSIKMIRQKRSVTAIQQEPISNTMSPHKKFKTAHVMVSSSPKYLPRPQPSPAAFPSLTTHCRDDLWGDDTAFFYTEGNVGQGLKSVAHNRQAPGFDKGRLSLTVQSMMNHPSPCIDISKRRSDIIEIRATDKLIHEVEMVFRAENPDRAQVEKAKLILREHERSLIEALAKIGDVSDGDDSPNRLWQRYSNEEAQRNGRHGSHHVSFGQVDRMRGYFAQDLHRDRADRLAITCINLQDEDGV